jgi:predicted metalloprotease with PDZ domain
MPTLRRCIVLALAGLCSAAATARSQIATFDVDAREAPRKVLRAHIVIPAQPGPLTLLYPKWIPGEHAPSGPLANLVDLKIAAGGKTLAWRRDSVEMTAVHCTVPATAIAVEVDAAFLYAHDSNTFSAGPSATDQLAILNWNQIVLYPQGKSADDLPYTASLRLPRGWDFATALHGVRSGDTVHFTTVSLTSLIDSPVLLGAHLRTVDLGEHQGAAHRLAIAADSAGALDAPSDFAAGYRRLVGEAQTLFAGHHYRAYTWLLALSDHVEHFGLEHHESSDNRREEQTLTKDEFRRTLPGLLAHEYTHSWNGKYRRPAGLLSPDYQKPMTGELLWVYEGLTQHVGLLLPARAGLWTAKYYREHVALIAARLDRQHGRKWRPLGDTADEAQVLYGAAHDWTDWRRDTDFYEESVLIWLEVDTKLRGHSGGKVTLDDFCHAFYGGVGPPAVKPYTLDDVVGTLQGLVPYDWRALFHSRLQEIEPRAPLAGLEASGWRLVYNDKPNEALTDSEARSEGRDWTFSLGLRVMKGAVRDISDGPAASAGIVPGMKILAVAGRVYEPRIVDAALREAKATRRPIEFIVQFGESVQTLRVDAFEGVSYPHLERIAGAPDVLADILRPHTAR